MKCLSCGMGEISVTNTYSNRNSRVSKGRCKACGAKHMLTTRMELCSGKFGQGAAAVAKRLRAETDLAQCESSYTPEEVAEAIASIEAEPELTDTELAADDPPESDLAL